MPGCLENVPESDVLRRRKYQFGNMKCLLQRRQCGPGWSSVTIWRKIATLQTLIRTKYEFINVIFVNVEVTKLWSEHASRLSKMSSMANLCFANRTTLFDIQHSVIQSTVSAPLERLIEYAALRHHQTSASHQTKDTCTSPSLFIAPATTETHHQDTFRRSRSLFAALHLLSGDL